MSIAEYKTPGELVAEIVMTRTGFSGSFLLVEGDDDSRFFSRRVGSACEIVIAGGKPALEGCIAKLDGQSFRGALGVCDDDCASLNATRQMSSNIVVVDARDLDAWLIRSPALDRVLGEYGDRKAIEAFEHANGSVRDYLLRLALPFGQLRWVSARDAEGINFDKLSPFRFVKSNWNFSADELIDEAVKLAQLDPGTLRARVASLPMVDPWLVCQGHDLLAILAIGLSSGGLLGSRNPSAKTIASTLRASLDAAYWRACQLVTDIHQWESNNSPYRIF